MLYSYKELVRLANLKDISIKQVCDAINSIGFEVEETIPYGDVEGIKFAKVLELSKNPNADKLNVAKLEFSDKQRVIQTTATNLKVGDVVIGFVPGSKSGGITFDAKEMKGVVSEGMLTSLNEFGVDKEYLRDGLTDGIMIYDVGDLSIDPIEYLGLQDTLIDVDVLSNRSDANSYYVMAKELAAYFHTNMEVPSIKEGNIKTDVTVTKGEEESLVMLEAKADFTITPAEQVLLAKHKVKSISDNVDITNLTLLMAGQPAHAYDKNSVGKNFSAKLDSGTVKVFGGKDVELKKDLVIHSDNKIVSIAGVIGSEQTGVKPSTEDFVIELGIFNIKQVRKASKAVKLDTAASIQSSKELGIGTTELALAYLTNRLNTFSNPVNLQSPKQLEVAFDSKTTAMLAGFDITKEDKYKEAIKSLEILGFKFSDTQVAIPTYRHGITHQQDLDEEIFRFYGYDNFKPYPPKTKPSEVKVVQNIKSNIAAQGYQEVVTYSLISESQNIINPFGFKEEIKLQTFVSKAREIIRNSLAHSMLEVIDYNVKRKINDVSIFAKGMISNGISAIALASNVKTFEQMKRDVSNLLPKGITFTRNKSKELHPGVSASIILDGKVIGWIGKVHPSLTKVDAFIAEFIEQEFVYTNSFADYSTDPLKSRDVTFELSLKEDIDSKLVELRKLNAYDIKVIDTFVKEDINKVTIRITAQDELIKKIEELLK